MIAACKEKGIKIIGMYLGGADRLQAMAMVMVDLITPQCDFVLVRSFANEDGLFTKICTDNKIPMFEIETILQIPDVIKAIFQSSVNEEPAC